jgi:hypothetical protein
MNAVSSRKHSYGWLLATVSALALLASVAAQGVKAAGDDESRPTVWIELGGHLERVDGQSAIFEPAFIGANAGAPAFAKGTPITAQALPRYAKGFEGTISLQPSGSDWLMSAGVIYGRSNGKKRVQYQTPGKPLPGYLAGNSYYDPAKNVAFTDTRSKDAEQHLIVDFKAGKDVGLGSSTLSLGVRFAQFTSDKTVSMRVRPDVHFTSFLGAKYMTTYAASGKSERSFMGIGPSISLDGSMKLAEDSRKSLTFDWGASGALLFGRQKAEVSEAASQTDWRVLGLYNTNVIENRTIPHPARSNSKIVPNLGGFAGVSVRYSNAKVSLGYRADFFFGAMDTGIDARETSNGSFHGPFATMSIGLGG